MPLNQDEIEYHKITSFYERVMMFSLGALAFFGSVVLAFTYQDRKSMLEEKEKTISELKTEIKELKDDSEKSIDKINNYAQNEISRIKLNTNQIALDETQKQLDYIFKTDKIQNLIQKQAINEVKDKVSEIVASETSDISKISDAAARTRLGHYEGLELLTNYADTLQNSTNKKTAKNLLIQISYDYYYAYLDDAKRFNLDSLHYTYDNKLPQKYDKKIIIEYLVNRINKKVDLNSIALDIILLSRISNKDFKPFQIKEINNWYNLYKGDIRRINQKK